MNKCNRSGINFGHVIVFLICLVICLNDGSSSATTSKSWSFSPSSLANIKVTPISVSSGIAPLLHKTGQNKLEGGGGGNSRDNQHRTDSSKSHTDHSTSGEHGGFQLFHVEFERVEVPFIISLWIFVSSLAKIGFHMTPKLHQMFPESCLLIVVGILIGFLLFLTSENPPSTLTPNIFFLFMLPPIILDAGYFMPNRLFFDHLGTILLMAVAGTIFNVLTIGASLWAVGTTGLFGSDPPSVLETFLFSSLISAVDPVAVLAVFEEIQVNEVLYIVVFGESLLNDAVTVVLYHMFEAYVELGQENIKYMDILGGLSSFFVVAVGGTVIGIVWGYITGFVTRFTNHARVLEPLFVFTMAYLSYLTAEIFHMSGILAITFCGITMKNYVERNISTKSQTTLKYAMKMLSGSSETIIFMFLGVATIHNDHDWNWWFIILTILFCTIFRILGVLILVTMANRYRLHKLKVVDQFVMMYGGLRGAVAFALVLLINSKSVPHAPMFMTTTIAVVYFTVFVQGITIKPLVKFLNIKSAEEKNPTMNERIVGRLIDHVIAGMEGILGEVGNLRMRDMYKNIDCKYIKPCLLRENNFRDPKIIETFEELTNRDVIEFMKRNPTEFAGLGRSLQEGASLSTLFRSSSQLKTDNSLSHIENLDMKEMNYTRTQRHLNETKIHHMLAENMFLPYDRPRRLSYSRHSIDESNGNPSGDVNYKIHMKVRRMMSDSKALRKRRTNATSGGNARYYSRVTGSSKQLKDDRIHAALKGFNEEEEDMNSASTAEIARGIGVDEGGIFFSTKNYVDGIRNPAFALEEDENLSNSSNSEGATNLGAIDTVLPWNRKENEVLCMLPVKQREFPGWINNRTYTDVVAQPPPVLNTDELLNLASLHSSRDSLSSDRRKSFSSTAVATSNRARNGSRRHSLQNDILNGAHDNRNHRHRHRQHKDKTRASAHDIYTYDGTEWNSKRADGPSNTIDMEEGRLGTQETINSSKEGTLTIIDNEVKTNKA